MLWYLILCCAVMLIIFNIFMIARGKKNTSEKKKSLLRTVGIIISFLFAMILLIYVSLFPPSTTIPTTGDFAYAYSVVEYEENRIEAYRNDNSNRIINALLYYPANETIKMNSCPLVVFSHGGIGVVNSNLSLYQELASHGYFVISINHTYQSLQAKIGGKTIYIDGNYMKEINEEDPKVNLENSFNCYVKWMDIRMGDIDYVIDFAKAHVDDHDSPYGLIDASKIAVMGHSLGGSAALGIGSIRGDISAVIALEAPFMYNIIGVKENDFIWRKELYPVPLLNIYTDSSYKHLNEWKQYKMNFQLLNSNNPDIYNVYIQGCGHFSITDLSLTSPILTRMLNSSSSKLSGEQSLTVVNKECLKFLDLYLK